MFFGIGCGGKLGGGMAGQLGLVRRCGEVRFCSARHANLGGRCNSVWRLAVRRPNDCGRRVSQEREQDRVSHARTSEAARTIVISVAAAHGGSWRLMASKIDCLSLSGLRTLDVEVAEVLAGFKDRELYLNGVTSLDAEAATAIAGLEPATEASTA